MDWTSIYYEDGNEPFAFPTTHELQQSRLARLISVVYLNNSQSQGQSSNEASSFANNNNNVASSSPNPIMRKMWNRMVFTSEATAEVLPVLQSPSSMTALTDKPPANNNTYSLSALYFLSINYILGVGCLGIPYAFARSGLILGCFLVVFVSLVSYMTVMWVAETGVRLLTIKERKIFEAETPIMRTSPFKNTNNNSGSNDERSSLLPLEPKSSEEDDHYEVIELIHHILGPIHEKLYQISLLFLMYVGLLAYSQVFAGAIGVLLPTNFPTYTSTLIFGILVVPLSCTELDEQISIQAIMALVRFLALGIMIVGSTMGLFLNGDDYDDEMRSSTRPYFAYPVQDKMSYTVSWSGFGVAFSTALFSQLFQHSVPGLLRPLNQVDTNSSAGNSINNNKNNSLQKMVPYVFAASLFTTASLYLILGISASSYFGQDTLSSVNLNFVGYNFGLYSSDTSNLSLLVLKVASGIVVLFPALDTLSVFPLISNTLGNNLLASLGKNTSQELPKWISENILKKLPSNDSYSNGNDNMKRASRIATIIFRLIASLPPLALSLYVQDLSFSLQIAGVCGVYVAFFAPSLLQLYSVRTLRSSTLRNGFNRNNVDCYKNIYSGWWSDTSFCIPVLSFATYSFIIVVYNLIRMLVK